MSKGEWCKIFDNYTKRNTDEEGKLKYKNLNANQMRGLSKLMKRVKEKEIVISCMDKSGHFFVQTFEKYTENGFHKGPGGGEHEGGRGSANQTQ